MSLPDILKKIIDDSQKAIKQIEAETEASKADVSAQFEAREARERKDLDVKMKKAIQSVDDKVRLMARRENAKLLLEAKQEVIQKALTVLLEHLENADEALYKSVLSPLFQKITEQEGVVYTSSKRVALTKSCLPSGSKFSVVADDHIKGGFIFRGKQSEIDNTFYELIFSEFRSDLTTYFAEQLRLI